MLLENAETEMFKKFFLLCVCVCECVLPILTKLNQSHRKQAPECEEACSLCLFFPPSSSLWNTVDSDMLSAPGVRIELSVPLGLELCLHLRLSVVRSMLSAGYYGGEPGDSSRTTSPGITLQDIHTALRPSLTPHEPSCSRTDPNMNLWRKHLSSPCPPK